MRNPINPMKHIEVKCNYGCGTLGALLLFFAVPTFILKTIPLPHVEGQTN